MHIVMHVLHATLALVIAFFVWFAASKSDGMLRTLGRVLGAWLAIVAVALLIFGFMGKHHEHGGMAPASDENTAAASNTPANTTP